MEMQIHLILITHNIGWIFHDNVSLSARGKLLIRIVVDDDFTVVIYPY